MSRALLSILVVAPLARPLLAQQSADDRFREVEAGFEDLSPNAVSNRLMPVDLRTPLGFERVYELVNSPGLFARRAGAVTAVFDRSVYRGDATPLVPPGTVFYVGSLPVNLGGPGLLSPIRRAEAPGSAWSREQAAGAGGAVGAAADRPIDLRVRAGGVAGEWSVPGPAPGPARSIWSSESYRQQRVGELLRGVEWKLRELEAGRGVEDGPGNGAPSDADRGGSGG